MIALFTHVVDTPNFSSELAAMIGLGVGIDYALFILTRFREAYRTPGPTFENSRESVVQAIDTAGRAVLFAGSTVVIALLGMMLLGVELPLRGRDLRVDRRAAGDARLADAAAGAADDRRSTRAVGGRRARARARAARAAGGARADGVRSNGAAGNGQPPPGEIRWAGLCAGAASCGAYPKAIAAAAAIAMLVIAAPAIALRLGSSDASSDPASQTTHRAYTLLAEGFGEGFNGPLLVVANLRVGHGAGSTAATGTGGAPAQSRLRSRGCGRRSGGPPACSRRLRRG